MDLIKNDTSSRPFTSANSQSTATPNDVAFSIGECALGKVLVARSPVGVLALDMRGTPFQRRVWHTLRAIPVGTTMTYSELARRIGAPKSARAVASACASNAIALAIPCHRVVRSNGALSGYRWGVERKRLLLNNEAVA